MVEKAKEFIDNVMKELSKVVWPEQDQLINSTFVVFVISALFTLFIWLADVAVSSIINLLYS